MADITFHASLDTSKLEDGTKRSNQKIGAWVNNVERSSARMGTSFTGTSKSVDSVTRSTQTLGQAVKRTSKEIHEQGFEIADTFGKVSRRMAAYASIWAGIGIAKQLIEITGQFQQLQIAFETMLDSKEKADRIMSESIALAQKTPFTLMDVTTNAKQLMAMGVSFEKVMGTIKNLGDVAAGVSVPLSRIAINYGQVLTLGRLQQREIRDFAMAGVPLVAELAKNMGKTTEEITAMVSAGKIGAKEVERAFQTMSSEGGRFYNLMEKQNKSITGQISNVVDKWQVMMAEIGNANSGAINDGIKLTAYLIENYKEIGTVVLNVARAYGAYRTALMLIGSVKSFANTQALLEEGMALSKITNISQELLIVKKGYVLGSVEYANAAKTLIEIEKKSLATTIATTNAKIAAQEKIVATKAAEITATNALMTTQGKELAMALTWGKQSKINAANSALSVSAKKLEKLETDRLTASMAVETFTTQRNTAVKRLNTIATQQQAVATGLLAKANIRLSQAMATISQVMARNPYTMLAAAIGGLIVLTYKLITADTALEKAQKKLNEKLKESRELKTELRSEASTLIGSIRDETKGVYEQVKAYDELIKRFSFFGKYSQKELREMSESDMNKLLGRYGLFLDKDMAQKAYDEQVKLIEELSTKGKNYMAPSWIKDEIEAEKKMLGTYYGEIARISKLENEARIQSMSEADQKAYYDNLVTVLTKRKEEINRQLMSESGKLTPSSSGETFSLSNTFIGQWEATQVDKNLKLAEAKLAAFRKSEAVKNFDYWDKIYKEASEKRKEMPETEIDSDEWKRLTSVIQDAKAKMDLYEDAKEKAAKTSDAYIKAQEDVMEKVAILDAKYNAERVASMRIGYEREVAEIKAGGEQKLAALNKEYSDLRQKMKTGQITVDAEGNITGTGMSEADLAALTATYQNYENHRLAISKQTDEELRQLAIDRDLEIKDIMEGQSTAFASEMDKQIADANRRYDNDLIRLQELSASEEQLFQLKKRHEEELANIKTDAAIRDIDFNEQMAISYIENSDKEYFFETTKQKKLLRTQLKFAKERLDEISKINTKEAKQDALAIGQDIAAMDKEIKKLSIQEVGELGRAFESVSNELQSINPQLANMIGGLGNIMKKAAGLKEAFGRSGIEGAVAGIGLAFTAANFISSIQDKKAQAAEERRITALERQTRYLERLNNELERGLDISNALFGTDKVNRYNKAITDTISSINTLQQNANVDLIRLLDASAKRMKQLSNSNWWVQSEWDLYNSVIAAKTALEEMINIGSGGKGTIFEQMENLDKQLLSNEAVINNTLSLLEKLNTYRIADKTLFHQDEYDAAVASLESVTNATQQLYDLREQLMEQVTGTGFSSIVDDMVSMFEKGFESFDELATDSTENFKKLMQKAVLASFQTRALEQPLRDWYEKFAEFSASDGSLNEKEIAKLRNEYQKIVDGAAKEFEVMKNIAGDSILSGSTTSQTGLRGQIRAELTEATGTELAGIFRSTRDDGRKALDTQRIGVSHLSKIENNTAQTVVELKNAIVELKEINKNTKGVYSAAL